MCACVHAPIAAALCPRRGLGCRVFHACQSRAVLCFSMACCSLLGPCPALAQGAAGRACYHSESNGSWLPRPVGASGRIRLCSLGSELRRGCRCLRTGSFPQGRLTGGGGRLCAALLAQLALLGRKWLRVAAWGGSPSWHSAALPCCCLGLPVPSWHTVNAVPKARLGRREPAVRMGAPPLFVGPSVGGVWKGGAAPSTDLAGLGA